MTTPPDAGGAAAAMSLERVSVRFRSRGRAPSAALKRVTLRVEVGETVALVGESGSGKTTIARVLLALVPASEGAARRFGVPIPPTLKVPAAERRRIQPVFQDPRAALNPAFDVFETLEEPLRLRNVGRRDRSAVERSILGLLDETGLPRAALHRPTWALSGGEQQRLCIARALAADPEALILDEPLSSLDLVLQARIVDLLAGLRRERRLTCLLISHDLRLVRRFAERVYVLYRGEVVEEGPTSRVLDAPEAPYTRRLVAAIPDLRPAVARAALEADAGSEAPDPDP
ncbi:MAG TPA: ATP-binding cassette domain-containing protein [Planctomycetota bacterium]|nr:ATP-binding cassette domain-containing protein [Planctomycetota bacterium]